LIVDADRQQLRTKFYCKRWDTTMRMNLFERWIVFQGLSTSC
jgi:hypothetical protein